MIWFLGCSRQDKASGGEPSKAVGERQARNENNEVRKKEKGKQREVVEEGGLNKRIGGRKRSGKK